MSTPPQRPDWAAAPPGTEAPAGPDGGVGGGRRLVLAAGLALAVGLGGGFFAGRTTAPRGPATLAEALQQAQAGELPTGDIGAGRQGGQGGAFPGGPPPGGAGGAGGPGGPGGPAGFQGEVTAVDGDVLTVQTQAGTIKVRIGDATEINRSTKGSRADLAVGRQVTVRPDLDAAGSGAGEVTAATITAASAR
jgi:hypothetical protein